MIPPFKSQPTSCSQTSQGPAVEAAFWRSINSRVTKSCWRSLLKSWRTMYSYELIMQKKKSFMRFGSSEHWLLLTDWGRSGHQEYFFAAQHKETKTVFLFVCLFFLGSWSITDNSGPILIIPVLIMMFLVWYWLFWYNTDDSDPDTNDSGLILMILIWYWWFWS